VDEVTRRDLFAMAALQGLLACPTTRIKAEDLAGQCYEIADAMLYEAMMGVGAPRPFAPRVAETENAAG